MENPIFSDLIFVFLVVCTISKLVSARQSTYRDRMLHLIWISQIIVEESKVSVYTMGFKCMYLCVQIHCGCSIGFDGP